ncbi:DNA-directed RNA polymerase I subunit RPA49-like isoform X1 [Mytilus edulis]|uniref:DNA-directed RNA polymerase I subunit RPA49-like isoform X1 n=2 Tax=Mytilus edulis TaxID=6550 RepID=UPI0039F0650C
MAVVTAHVVTGECYKKNIAHFTNGEIKENHTDGLSVGQFIKAGDNRKRKHTILVGETETMSYVGKNFGPDASKAQSYCRYYIGVVDRKRGKMKVFDSEIIQMVPKQPDFQEEAERSQIALPANGDKTYKQRIDDLTANFGSKKKKQAMGSRLRNEIHGEALEKSLNSVATVAASQNKHKPVNKDEQQSTLLPVYYKDGETPKDVYPLESVLNQEAMDSMMTPAQLFYDSNKKQIKEWNVKEEYPKYILNHLSVLPSSTDQRWYKSKILMYLHYLMNVFMKPAKDFKTKNPLPKEWPDKVKKQIYDDFTLLADSGKREVRCLPSRLKDKLALHILVLCLILDEFDLPLNDLQRDLKLGAKSLDSYVRAIGCKMNIKKITAELGEKLEIKSAILQLPLRFPEAMPRKAKARR